VPAATSIRNAPGTTSSRDQAWRATVSWTQGAWQSGIDLATMRYSENDAVAAPGKFRAYRNIAWQLGAEYAWSENLRFGANHANASAGSCRLAGGTSCSTTGLGGRQTTLGVFYGFAPMASLFALAALTRNNPAAQYNSAPQGADVNAYALGVKYTF
jgi:hypothetical protein